MKQSHTITLEWVREQKSKLQAQLADLEAAERVLLVAGLPGDTLNYLNLADFVPATGYGAKKRTLLYVISAAANGLTTAGVIELGTSAGLQNLKTENVSPQLSLYKSEGLLTQENGLWRITREGREFLASFVKS